MSLTSLWSFANYFLFNFSIRSAAAWVMFVPGP
jgi:hypothetical protein